ncbi:MAG TPA: hypothetical protein VFA78_07355 [Chloroflexota bacterium]|nr:hypothetical protein [Chloroflexota bacterium]
MSEEPTSEQTFLLSELRYSIGQLHVQLGNLEPGSLDQAPPGHPTINSILDTLIQREKSQQATYARMLNLPAPSEESVEGDREEVFDTLRDRTIALLEQAPSPWPRELIDAVQQQVSNDRQSATEIAERRTELAQQPLNPHLEQPLTETNP